MILTRNSTCTRVGKRDTKQFCSMCHQSPPYSLRPSVSYNEQQCSICIYLPNTYKVNNYYGSTRKIADTNFSNWQETNVILHHIQYIVFRSEEFRFSHTQSCCEKTFLPSTVHVLFKISVCKWITASFFFQLLDCFV